MKKKTKLNENVQTQDFIFFIILLMYHNFKKCLEISNSSYGLFFILNHYCITHLFCKCTSFAADDKCGIILSIDEECKHEDISFPPSI